MSHSMQAIFQTLKSGLVNVQNAIDTIDTIENDDEREVKFDTDPIAIAWARHRESHTLSYAALGQAQITDYDYEQALKIRKYYSDRYAMTVLRGHELSEFRTKLYGLMQGIRPLKRKDLGLLYKLPYFYEEDQFLEDLVKRNFSPIGDQKRPLNVHEIKEPWTLTPVGHYLSNRKHATGANYFWTNKENNLVCWTVDSKNSLYSLVKGLYDTNKPLKIEASYVPSVRYVSCPLYFYRVVNPRLVLE